jgi:hypothetical protein
MIRTLITKATKKENFVTLEDYFDFCREYLDFIAGDNLQAKIIAKNQNNYQFWQYKEEANFQITRPINSNLMYDADHFENFDESFIVTLQNLRDLHVDNNLRNRINNTVYTVQQTIGSALDGLPAGSSNTARKINGDLFERFIKLILVEMGVDAVSGVIKVPVLVDGEELFSMNYQHDLIISYEGEVKVIGGVKTSSKDRIDKIFMDKFLYSKITESDLPHIAIFLNDMQRAGKFPNYKVSGTFLPGHFKGYTIKLNPLDGVYYCDIQPRMRTENILKDQIFTLDKLLCTDIWKWLKRKEVIPLAVEPDPDELLKLKNKLNK